MKNFKTQEEFITKIIETEDKTRTPLTGHSFEIRGSMGELKYKVDVKKLVGAGASCLVYEVDVDDTYPPVKKMIMKEFYPSFTNEDIKGVRDENNPLTINFESGDEDGLLTLVRLRQKFVDSYAKHINIIEIDPLLEDKIVRPYKLEESPNHLFALYDTDNALSVDKYYNLDLGRIINILKQAADILTYLHQKDIIYMDLKPANILYDYKRDKVKLFDFDAAIVLDELDEVNEFYMPSERSFIPPELRYVSNINKRKEIFITEEIDLYMLGVTFFYLLMDRFPVDLENEDMDYLERNVRETLQKRSNQIFLNQRSTDRIVDLLKETLSVHRYITVRDFRDRLDEIQLGLDFDKNKKIANVLVAAYILENNPLYNYINEDETSRYIDIDIVGNLDRGLDFFNLIFAAVDLLDAELRFNFYLRNPREGYRWMTSAMPLLKETCKITVDGRVKNDKINPMITSKSYANINFTSDMDAIAGHYIIILHEDGINYYSLGQNLFEKFENVEENRYILNYTRHINELESRSNDYVRLFNIDISSAATFRNKEYSENILEEAFDVHRFYTRAYGSERADNGQMWEDFIKDDLYNLKSSLRAALSMRYKMYRAGSLDAYDPQQDYYDKVVSLRGDDDSLSLRDLFADSEHHSWNRFMITQGYRLPTEEEFSQYAYQGRNNHINREKKLHPLIINTDIRKFKEGENDVFQDITDRIENYLINKTQNIDKRVLDRINHTLNNTSWHLNDELRNFLPLWEELANVTYRIIDKEAFSANTWRQLAVIMDERLKEEFLGKDEILADYKLVKKDINLLIQKNSHMDFRSSDYMIIDATPLIKSGSVKTVFKPFVTVSEYLWANVLGAIRYAPRNFYLVTEDKDRYKNEFNTIVAFMKEKRLQQSMTIELISYEDMELYSKDGAVVDLTLNTHTDARRKEFKGMEYVEYIGSNQWRGDYRARDYYINKRALTVEESFYLNNAIFYNATSENNLSRLSDYYEDIWQAYISYPSYQWNEFNRLFKGNINQYILNVSYPVCEKTSMIEVGNFIFKRDDKLKYPKLTSFLEDLKAEGILIDYKFPVNPGKIKLHTINDYLTVELGEFISNTLTHYYQIFDLRKLYFPLLDEDEVKNIYYYAMSNNTRFSYKMKHTDPTKAAFEMNQLMERLDEDRDEENEIRVFNPIDKLPYAKANGDKVEFNYHIGDVAFREFFEKGIALQIYTYFELVRKTEIFDEIKLDVRLKWKAYDDYAPISEGVENHIDIVCTKEFSTFIISCIQDEVTSDAVYEISSHAKQFGIDTKPILISSYSEGINPSIRKIARATGVSLIDRDMLVENGVADYLVSIAKADRDFS